MSEEQTAENTRRRGTFQSSIHVEFTGGEDVPITFANHVSSVRIHQYGVVFMTFGQTLYPTDASVFLETGQGPVTIPAPIAVRIAMPTGQFVAWIQSLVRSNPDWFEQAHGATESEKEIDDDSE